jgi:iron-only hydrogenase group A
MEKTLILKDNSIEFDRSKCIKCTKCVQRCTSIGICHLEMKGEGKERYVDFNGDNPCVNCGQCTLVCPINSMREQSSINTIKTILSDKDKIKIVQCAPSVRTSINEIFKLEYDIEMEKKLNTCFRLLGFDKVFDVNFGADITSIIEAEELLERLEKNEHLPMFTSCCPSWVNFVNRYKPELINNLTTSMSPHIHAGLAYKTWWAEKEKINPKDIVVVSIMPCTSKKDEIYVYDDMKAVDHVLTVRELGKLLKEMNIELGNAEKSDGDSLAEYSGGAVIYGKSGGVMESALRIVKKKVDNEDFEKLILNDNINYKDAVVNVGGTDVKIAVLSCPKNFREFIDGGKYKEYHYIEIMNCNGGCINGGGQPLLPPKPGMEEEIIKKRKEVLQNIDVTKTTKRNAFDNESVKEYLAWANEKSFKNKLFYVK